MSKRYDREYFDTWYRHHGINRGAALTRKVALAVACAEFHLGRPIRSVLDVGCGEAVWRAPLLRMRPRLRYLGLDASEYVVTRFGRSRGVRAGRFGDLASLRFDAGFDLLVCADVLHYLGDNEIRAGLSGIPDLCQGVAYLETYCAEDDIEGDLVGLHRRPADWYRRRFAEVGLGFAGSHCWLAPGLAGEAMAMETPGWMPDRARSRR